MSKSLKVGTLVERLRETLSLEVLAANDGLDREIATPEAASPGLVLAGFVGRFLHQRVQVMGETEITYLDTLSDAERSRVLMQFFAYPLPVVFLTKGLEPSAVDPSVPAVLGGDVRPAPALLPHGRPELLAQ